MKHNNQACCRKNAMGSKFFWKNIFVTFWRSSSLRPFFLVISPESNDVCLLSNDIVCILASQIVTVFFVNWFLESSALILIDLVLIHFLLSIHHALCKCLQGIKRSLQVSPVVGKPCNIYRFLGKFYNYHWVSPQSVNIVPVPVIIMW